MASLTHSISDSHLPWRIRDLGKVGSLFLQTLSVDEILKHMYYFRIHFTFTDVYPFLLLTFFRFVAGKPYYVTGWQPSTGITTFGGKLGAPGFQSKGSKKGPKQIIWLQYVQVLNQQLILTVQTLPLETCCSHAPPPLVQAVAQVQAHQQHQRLHVRTAPPQMVVNASSHSSSMGRNTTAARWTSQQRAPPLHGAPHGLTELETG